MNEKILSHEELKEALCQMLYDFSEYCEKHQLKYVLCCGTLLGAIRHQGMIPWDDDIDVSMPREDFDKLHELIKTDPLKSQYCLESLLAGNSANPYAKIFDRNVELVEAESAIKNSIWIDVFPVDGIPDEIAADYRKLSSKVFNYCRFLEKAAKPIKFYGFSPYGLKLTVSTLIAHLKSAEYYGQKLDAIARKYKMSECQYATSICWNGIRGILKSERFYTNREKRLFEGHEYYIPQDWDEYLTKFYGDYMQIPPESERETHNVVARRIK